MGEYILPGLLASDLLGDKGWDIVKSSKFGTSEQAPWVNLSLETSVAHENYKIRDPASRMAGIDDPKPLDMDLTLTWSKCGVTM